MNVYETLARAARQWPNRPAIIDPQVALDYRTFWREVEALRMQLERLGVRPGQGVGVLARNGSAFVISALAALGCGAVVMPMYHQLKPEELKEMLARASIAAVLSDGSCPHPLEGVTHTVQLGDGRELRFTRLTACDDWPLAPWFEDAAFVRFTSGTTGTAKGVVLTHQGVLERCRAANVGLGLGDNDTVLWVLPMAYHFFVSIVLYLEVGATIVVTANHLAGTILAAAARHQATFLYAAPLPVRLLAAEASDQSLPPSLKRVMSVSSSLPRLMAAAFVARYGLPVCQGYGVIEVGLPIMNLDDAREHPGAIGRPLPDFEAVMLDARGAPVADGETGELALRGPGMFAGYLSPRRDRDAVLQDGWFRTGDLAHRDPAGRITIDGRSKSVINVAGHKVFPEEVTAVLDQHEAVYRSRVSARRHPQLGEIVHAEVQLNGANGGASPEAILAFCRRRLSSYKVPARIEVVEAVDLTSSGKVRQI